MADNSGIDWCDATWSPVLGCRKVSRGCDNCYAIRSSHRMAGNPNEKISSVYAGLTQIQNGRPNWTGVFRELPERLSLPLSWKKPRRVFVNSMSDLFGEGISDEFIWRVFAIMASASRHQFQVLTKRPERARSLLGAACALFSVQCAAEEHCAERGWCHMGEDDFRWPLPNCWLGVSCEDQKTADERIPLLLQTPAAVRFLSCEPLLGRLGLGRFFSDFELGRGRRGNLHWVIVGAESGHGARPMELDWAREIRDECLERRVPFFLKQFSDSHGRKIHTPELDGRRWMEYPAT